MTIVLIGIGVVFLTEAVAWVNKKLVDTVLAGKGASIVSIVVSLVGATGYAFYGGTIHSFHDFVASLGQIWAASQVFYTFVYTKIDEKLVSAGRVGILVR